jgi:hypothetical protein
VSRDRRPPLARKTALRLFSVAMRQHPIDDKSQLSAHQLRAQEPRDKTLRLSDIEEGWIK